MEQENKKKFDYTWVIVLCCFLMVFTGLGFCSSPKQFFVKPVCKALGIERGAYALNTTFRYATMALMNVFFGTLVYKFKPHKLIIAGFLMLIASTTMYACATNLWMIYGGSILLGVGLSFTANTMASYVINARCRSNTGTILGVVMASNGLGGAIAMQIVCPIINSHPEGFRKAYFVVVAILAAVGFLVAVLFRDDENAIPQKPKGKKVRGQGWEGITFQEAKKKSYFIPTAVCLFLTGFVLSGINGISTIHMKQAGAPETFVENIWKIHSLILVAPKFLTGFIYDRKGLRVCLLMCQASAILVMIALALVNASPFGLAMCVLYSIGSTLALPLETIGVPLVTGDIFGNKEYGKFLGLTTALNSLGLAVGDPVMNFIYDQLGSYTLAIWIAVGVIAVATVSFQFILTAAHKDREKILAQAN